MTETSHSYMMKPCSRNICSDPISLGCPWFSCRVESTIGFLINLHFDRHTFSLHLLLYRIFCLGFCFLYWPMLADIQMHPLCNGSHNSPDCRILWGQESGAVSNFSQLNTDWQHEELRSGREQGTFLFSCLLIWCSLLVWWTVERRKGY